MKSHFNQKFDIDVYFTIRYFDVDANGIRCASKSWEILEVRK